jgi:hypothetical protein
MAAPAPMRAAPGFSNQQINSWTAPQPGFAPRSTVPIDYSGGYGGFGGQDVRTMNPAMMR